MAFLQGKASTYLSGWARYLKATEVLVTEVLPLNGTFRQKASQMASDRRHAQTGHPNLGSGMEKKILDLELTDLETTMGIQESTERTVIRNIRPARTDT